MPDQVKTDEHQVLCGNIGYVYTGDDGEEARQAFEEYVSQSEAGYGRAAFESVVWVINGETHKEHSNGDQSEVRSGQHYRAVSEDARCGNFIVIGCNHHNELRPPDYLCLTDFGNAVTFTTGEITSNYRLIPQHGKTDGSIRQWLLDRQRSLAKALVNHPRILEHIDVDESIVAQQEDGSYGFYSGQGLRVAMQVDIFGEVPSTQMLFYNAESDEPSLRVRLSAVGDVQELILGDAANINVYNEGALTTPWELARDPSLGGEREDANTGRFNDLLDALQACAAVVVNGEVGEVADWADSSCYHLEEGDEGFELDADMILPVQAYPDGSFEVTLAGKSRHIIPLYPKSAK